MIKYYGTAELLVIQFVSVSLSRVKFIRHYADMAELADAYGSGHVTLVKNQRSHYYVRPFLVLSDGSSAEGELFHINRSFKNTIMYQFGINVVFCDKFINLFMYVIVPVVRYNDLIL